MALFSKEPDRGPRIQPPQVTNPQPRPTASGLRPETLSTAPAPEAQEPAYLGRNSKVSGRLAFGGSARIDGQIDGEITVKDSLHIGKTGIIGAEVKATSITVAGRVSGDITGTRRIELRSSAKVVGDLVAPVVVIQEGAEFEGYCSTAIREDRKATVLPQEEPANQVALAMSNAEQKPVPTKSAKASAI